MNTKSRLAILFISVNIFTSYANNNDMLWYQAPASEWMEALPLGNGRIGAMVYGGINHDRIALN